MQGVVGPVEIEKESGSLFGGRVRIYESIGRVDEIDALDAPEIIKPLVRLPLATLMLPLVFSVGAFFFSSRFLLVVKVAAKQCKESSDKCSPNADASASRVTS